MNNWEEFYKNNPLEKIPWQKTQADFLSTIINSDKVEVGSALDLGCGTGIKSIFLTKKGFDVIGVDISETAIKYAMDNAEKEGVKVAFINKDASDLTFLGDKKFDLILDWANLHGIKEELQEKYVSEILKHINVGGKLILRCFGRQEGESKYVNDRIGVVTPLTLKELEGMYGPYFKILEKNISNSQNSNAPSKFFYEFLMERI